MFLRAGFELEYWLDDSFYENYPSTNPNLDIQAFDFLQNSKSSEKILQLPQIQSFQEGRFYFVDYHSEEQLNFDTIRQKLFDACPSPWGWTDEDFELGKCSDLNLSFFSFNSTIKIVPRLRFIYFRHNGEWVNYGLNRICPEHYQTLWL